MQIREKKLVQEVVTRWNSSFYMLERALVGTGWAVLLCIIGFRKQSSHLVGSPFLALKFFAVWMGDCWQRALTVESGSGYSHKSAQDNCKGTYVDPIWA